MLSCLRAIPSQNEFVKSLFAQKTIHLVVQEQVEEKKKAKKCFACHKLCRAVCFSVSGAVHGTEHQRCVVCTAFAGFAINLNLYQGRRKRTSPSKVTIWQCYVLGGFGLFGQCFRLMLISNFWYIFRIWNKKSTAQQDWLKTLRSSDLIQWEKY